MNFEIVIPLPLTAPLLTSNMQRRAHWTQVREAKQATELVVAQAIRKAKIAPIQGLVSVRLRWYVTTRHRRDVDGLAPMLKACLDALVKQGIISDDNFTIVHEGHLGPIIVAASARMEIVICGVDVVG